MSCVANNFCELKLFENRRLDMDSYLKSQIKCSVCFKVMLKPKTLKCLHTFCDACVDKKINTQELGCIVCPCCEQTCSPDDVNDNLRVRELVAIRHQRETGAVQRVILPKHRPDPVEQLQSLRDELCAQIDARKQANDSAKKQLVETVQMCQTRWVTAFNQQCSAVISDIQEKFDSEEGYGRLLKARDMVTAWECYLRTCQPRASPIRKEASRMASVITQDVTKIMQEIPRLNATTAAFDRVRGLVCSADGDSVDDVAARLFAPRGFANPKSVSIVEMVTVAGPTVVDEEAPSSG